MDWFISDHLGSTKVLIDQYGQHRFTGDDDPFGINLRSFGDKDTHRYTGQILDEEQGLYYYGARYYLPEMGRFLSGDPLGGQLHSSTYGYVFNNPLGLTDPDGREPFPRSEQNPNWRVTAEERQVASDIWNKSKAWVHATLDGLGFLPSAGAAPDLINAGIYAGEGEFKEAGWSSLAAIPFIGDIVAGSTKGTKAIKLAVEAKKVKQEAELTRDVAKEAKGPIHHLLTNKNKLSKARGGPWTPRFADMAKKGGMTLEDALNKVRIPGHRGPHPEAYHQAVFQRLSNATEGLEGGRYADAFKAELNAIRTEAVTPGSALNNLLTGK